MSAWTHLVARATTPEEIRELDEALVEVQTEQARRLARKQRANLEVTGDWACCTEACTALIDLIDPDVPEG